MEIKETTWEIFLSDLPHNIVHHSVLGKCRSHILQEKQMPENGVTWRHRLGNITISVASTQHLPGDLQDFPVEVFGIVFVRHENG